MSETTFKPHLKPRNAGDGLISLAVGLFIALAFLGVPAVIVFMVTNSQPLAWGAAGAAYLVYASFTVSKLIVTPEGIRLVRFMGGPEFIPWASVESIEEAPRLELIWRGWLWPLFPAREMTPSFTSLGHYRIRFDGQAIYYPPENGAALVASVQSYLGKRAQQSAGA